MITINSEYQIKKDIEFLIEAEKINKLEFSERTQVSRVTLDSINKNGKAEESVLEKIYSYAYRNKYRINAVKEEILKEKYEKVLFHGSKNGLNMVAVDGSRDNCDFGKGFYLGETYNQALSFVAEKEGSSVYSFLYMEDELKIKRFECNLEWMLAICFYRGTLGNYSSSKVVLDIINEVESCDVIVAPIADNKMFHIMNQFTDGDINADVALHSLSASKLGYQYVFKTEKALNQLRPVEKYYISIPERDDCRNELIERSYEIDTKLKLAKREFKSGLFIEEILNEEI